MDLKNGQMRQLTEAEDLDPASITLLADDHGFCYFDGDRLMAANLANLKTREVYRISDGFRRSALNLAEDGQYAVVVEKKDATHRLQLVSMASGTAKKLVECDEEIRDPLPRPKRASILYARGPAAGGNVWLADYDGQHNYRLRITEGGTGPAMWSPDGRTVLYLNYPEDSHKLHAIREFTPDANDDKMVANTSQFVQFGCNADASVFVGASGSKASPYVLLLVRTVHREMTLAEHRASDPAMVAPIFAPNSQRIFFGSDRHGKAAIYSMSVERFVEETDADRG
jgi:oligogalacturonide lyase